MSRKTKRLERENLNLIRKHDLTSRNILGMAEERTRMNKEMELLKKKNANLEKLCRGMQAQGRGTSLASSTSLHAKPGDGMAETDRTESEYEYEDEDEDEDEDDEDVGDEDENEDDEDDEEEEDGLFVAERSYRDPDATSTSEGHLLQGHTTAIRAGGVKQRRGPTYGSVPDSVSSMAPSSAAPAIPSLARIMPAPTTIASRAPHLPPPSPPPAPPASSSSPEAHRSALRQQQQQQQQQPSSSQPQRPQVVGGGTRDGSFASASKPSAVNILGRGAPTTGAAAGGINHASGVNNNSNGNGNSNNSGSGGSSNTVTPCTAGVAPGVEGSRHGGSTKH